MYICFQFCLYSLLLYCFVPFLLLYIAVSFQFLYKFTDQDTGWKPNCNK